MTFTTNNDDVTRLNKQTNMFVKFLSIPLLSFGFLEILAFSSSNMASSAYGERGKGGVVRCCEEFVDMPTGIPTGTPSIYTRR